MARLTDAARGQALEVHAHGMKTTFARTSRVLMTCVAVAMAWSFAPAVTHAQDAPVDPEPAQEEPEVSAEDAAAAAQAAAAAAQAAATAADRTSARSAMAESRWEDAAAAWNNVLAAAPGDVEAVKGLASAQAAIDQASTIAGVQDDLQLRRQRALIEFNAGITRAGQQLSEGDYDGAQRTALTAKVRLDRNRNILAPAAFQEAARRAETLLEQISDAKINSQLVQQDMERAQARTAASEQQRLEAADRERQIRESIIRVRELQLEMKYDEALQVIEQILFMDPLNPAALALRDVIKTSKVYIELAQINRFRAYAVEEFSVDIARSMLPPRRNISGPGMKSTNALVTYPEDWPQLSKQRSGASGYNESPANLRVQSALENDISVNFNHNSFDQVINYMKTVTGVEVYADWQALETISIRADDEISLDLGRVRADVALRRVLEQLGDHLDRPQFGIEDGMVVITTEDALRKRMVTLVYDIRDLLLEVPYFDNAPDFNLGTAINGGPGARGGQGTFGSVETESDRAEVFGGGSGDDDPRRRDRDVLVDEIMRIIQDVVDPEKGWYDTSGQGGKIQELNGNLIITNSPRNHRAIEGLLNQLRTIRALQINVEARLLNVSMDWFEEIGLDMDLYFNTNDTMYDLARQSNPYFQLSDFFNPNAEGGGRAIPNVPFYWVDQDTYDGTPNTRPITPTGTVDPADPTGIGQGYGGPFYDPPFDPVGREQGWDPIAVSQGSMGLIRQLAGSLSSTVALAALSNPALAVGISYLDDVQVDLLIEATQADQRNTVLTAPRLSLFNGQRSWISVAEGITYISDLVPVTGDASGAFDPITDVVYQGFVLDVEAVISADRRYVTMTVSFNLNQNVQFEDVPITGAAGGGGFGGGRSSSFFGVIQLPRLQGTQIRTTVSVPDRGTILLGGQRIVTEVEIEAGVPVLSKIPLVNRFFTNRITSKQEATMLLLIRPEIIIHQENEDDLFPGLSEQLGAGSSYIGF